MYEIYYNIAEVVIKVISPFRFFAGNGVDFECNPEKPNYVFRFEQYNNIPKLMDGAVYVANLMWAHEYRRQDGSYMRAFLWEEKYYTEVSILGEDEGVCYYASADILADRARNGFELLMYLCLECIFLIHQALVLHSSHIAVGEKGVVFSAPSQTGKSTQAELWEKFAQADIINGDRSILRKKDGRWRVYGCPMCGTSNIHKQSNEMLSAVVMLSQSKENIVERINGLRAFQLVYPQITVSNWDSRFVERVIKLLNELLQEVPIWAYGCNMEQEAVWFLKETLRL